MKKEEDLKVTMERFEYFIQIMLKGYKEPPLMTVMFKEGKSVKKILPLDDDLNNFQLRSVMALLSFDPDQIFICIPCNDGKYDAVFVRPVCPQGAYVRFVTFCGGHIGDWVLGDEFQYFLLVH